MALQSNHRLSSAGVVVRLVWLAVGLFLVCYVIGPPLIGRSSPKPKSAAAVLCPKCTCDCLSQLDLSSDIVNPSSSDCSSEDPEMNKELGKDIIALLSEEINLQKNVTRDTLEHTEELIMDARRTSLHYQRESEKCIAMVGTCEDARERAKAALAEERMLTMQWEQRARNFGWTDEKRV